ncbi:sigma-70 family RNA polymerase sigma factor [Romboutsia weinsteinii]|uniref:Sigma-70 family RNA polymerase sigma factor n=1 Tax=Romboutsia weinsteinii TaxID=2020949 RepID=A0A371J080_9FIRM|nr:sigma-70 family RNA polymerase sigma factor [Romboutsia weinsteinii]RDY26211.1 sigma-70 family RNA polymerase sigma factor [Romboutsia weinsteinii]
MKVLSLVERKKEKKLKKYIVDNKEALYRFAYSYVHNEDDALDIVHDSICKSLANINTLKDTDSIKPWMYRIVSNCAIDYIRKNKKYVTSSEDIELDDLIGYDKYEDIDLQRALDLLPEKYRTIVILRYFEDMKIADIAKMLDENENTIKTRLYNALDKLKISISE